MRRAVRVPCLVRPRRRGAQLLETSSVVRTVVETYSALAISKKLQYHLLVDPALPARLHSDEVRLQQLLGNLISMSPGEMASSPFRTPPAVILPRALPPLLTRVDAFAPRPTVLGRQRLQVYVGRRRVGVGRVRQRRPHGL